jgi:four helix bundle protein
VQRILAVVDDRWCRAKGVAEDSMALRIYDTTVEMVRSVAAFARRIEQADGDLARQMRRASSSVTLNLAEGLHSRGRNRESRLFTAMGSAKETLACVDVAVASTTSSPRSTS